MAQVAGKTQKGRCVSCRAEIAVPDNYVNGDTIPCGTCALDHRVQKDEQGRLKRLVVADVAPLKEQLEQNRRLVSDIEREYASARASLGIGANGLGLGLLYVVAQVGLEERTIDTQLLVTAAVIAIVAGVGLEAANFLFLAKRSAMARLSEQLSEAKAENRRLEQIVRDAIRASRA
jgi:hypothetical protein